ncbi:hypothetical protein ACLOJK_003641 [Asimina triloba]
MDFHRDWDLTWNLAVKPMENHLQQYDKEYMKMAMLKHEETFKEQVFELHRLYRIQKRLMQDMQSRSPKKDTTSRHPCDFRVERYAIENNESQASYDHKDERGLRLTIDLEQPAEEYATACDGGLMLGIEQESDIELTLGRGYGRRKKGAASLASDSGQSFSSSSSDSSSAQKKTVGNSHQHDWGLFQTPDMNSSIESETNNHFAIEDRRRQERLSQPPWLFHCLSLNLA